MKTNTCGLPIIFYYSIFLLFDPCITYYTLIIFNSVWCEINSRLNSVLNVWFEQPEHIYQGLLKFQRQLVSKLVARLGWEYSDNDEYLTTMLRSLVIKMAGRANDPEYVNLK